MRDSDFVILCKCPGPNINNASLSKGGLDTNVLADYNAIIFLM